jgi:hypothetical protein
MWLVDDDSATLASKLSETYDVLKDRGALDCLSAEHSQSHRPSWVRIHLMYRLAAVAPQTVTAGASGLGRHRISDGVFGTDRPGARRLSPTIIRPPSDRERMPVRCRAPSSHGSCSAATSCRRTRSWRCQRCSDSVGAAGFFALPFTVTLYPLLFLVFARLPSCPPDDTDSTRAADYEVDEGVRASPGRPRSAPKATRFRNQRRQHSRMR